jgi:hypothetical protein
MALKDNVAEALRAMGSDIQGDDPKDALEGAIWEVMPECDTLYSEFSDSGYDSRFPSDHDYKQGNELDMDHLMKELLFYNLMKDEELLELAKELTAEPKDEDDEDGDD